jgi:hypothetical protein
MCWSSFVDVAEKYGKNGSYSGARQNVHSRAPTRQKTDSAKIAVALLPAIDGAQNVEGVAEGKRSGGKARRFRWPVWMALVAGLIPLIAFWPLLMNIKTYYGPKVFSRPVFSAVRGYYASFFLLTHNASGVALAVVAAVAIAWSLLGFPRAWN